jgi:hypothetical protein
VWEEISDGQDILKVGNYEISSRAYVGRFNFRGAEQQKKIGLDSDMVQFYGNIRILFLRKKLLGAQQARNQRYHFD